MRGHSLTEPTHAEILDAISGILHGVETALQTTTCTRDGCLIIGGTPCPACQVRRRKRRCGCGRRLNCPEADQCHVCLRHARIAARRVCPCGTAIRTDADLCSRCARVEAARLARLERAEGRRVCGCGTTIRTDADKCHRCREKLARARGASDVDPGRFRWVQRGGIKRAVFDQGEVA